MNADNVSSPFEETESEASLRRIAEAVRAVEQMQAVAEDCRLAYRSAKEALAKARQDLYQIEKAETEELPLFPRPRVDPPKANGSAPAGSSPAPSGVADPDAVTFLSSLKSFPSGALIPLGAAGIQTVADLKAFLGDGGKLADVEGLGEGVAAKILAALKRHEESSKGDDAY